MNFSYFSSDIFRKGIKDRVGLNHEVLKKVTQGFHTKFHIKLPKHSLYTTILPLKVFHSEQQAKSFSLSPYSSLTIR